MQNNGLIKFFTVLFGLVSLYELSFTFVTSKVESDAKTYAQASVNTDDADYFTLVDIAERNYLDSIAEQKVFGVFNYATAKDRELNKGLDLKGGINVILQVSVKDILKGLAENSRNPLFNQSLARADVLQKSSDDMIKLTSIIETTDNTRDTIGKLMWSNCKACHSKYRKPH